MSCGLKIIEEGGVFDFSCIKPNFKNNQSVTFIKKSDVLNFQIKTPSFKKMDYSIEFELKAGVLGFGIITPEKGDSLMPNSSKFERNGITQFSHSITVSIPTLHREDKILIDFLCSDTYFAIIEASRGIYEIYGFENGLKALDFSNDRFANKGFARLTLQTPEGTGEDTQPLLWNYPI